MSSSFREREVGCCPLCYYRQRRFDTHQFYPSFYEGIDVPVVAEPRKMSKSIGTRVRDIEDVLDLGKRFGVLPGAYEQARNLAFNC